MPADLYYSNVTDQRCGTMASTESLAGPYYQFFIDDRRKEVVTVNFSVIV